MAFMNETRSRAAELVAEGRLTDEQIASESGVTRDTITRWKRRSDFRAEVERHTQAARERITDEGIASRKQRIEELKARHAKLKRVIEERAEAPEVEAAAGGTTGLIVRQQKSLGSGLNATIVDEFSIDTGLLKELREIEKQVAQEKGEWTEKRELMGKGGGPIETKNANTTAAERLGPYLDIIEQALEERACQGTREPGSNGSPQ